MTENEKALLEATVSAKKPEDFKRARELRMLVLQERMPPELLGQARRAFFEKMKAHDRFWDLWARVSEFVTDHCGDSAVYDSWEKEYNDSKKTAAE